MATAAQTLAIYGLSVEEAHGWLMANMTNPQYVYETCQAYGITNTNLGQIAGWPGTAIPKATVKAFFLSQGINSEQLDPGWDSPAVVSITSTGSTEAHPDVSHVHTVVLASAPTSPAEYEYAFVHGTATGDDFAGDSFSDGVTWNRGVLVVPAGVSQFNYIYTTVDDDLVEGVETYGLTVGDITINSTLADNDTGGGGGTGGSSILSDMLDGFASVLDLNDRTGALATATIRAQVISSTNSASYWALFDPTKFEGSADGVFTPAELGVSHLGTLPATAETIESLFYGTFIDVALSIDFEEAGPINTFFFGNLPGIQARTPAVIEQYVDILVNAAADPAVLQVHPEAALPAQMVAGMINYASHVGLGGTNNIFDALLTI